MTNLRNFNCPVTDEPCVDGRCKKDKLCIAQALERAGDPTVDESDREWRIRNKRATADDLGL